MADKLQVYKVSCRGGLDTNNDADTVSQQAPGSAIRLLNYEPSLKGGYQRINGFTHNYGTIEGKGSVLGLAVLDGWHRYCRARRYHESGDVDYDSSDDGNFLYKWNDTTDSWDCIKQRQSYPTFYCKED